MLRNILLAGLLLATTAATAQHARVRKYTTPLAGVVVLKEAEDKYNAQVYSLEAPPPDAHTDKAKLRRIKEESAKLYPHRISNAAHKTTAVTPPVVETSFLADSFPGIPPDNDLAVSGGGKAVSVMNNSIAVLDGNTGQMLNRKGLMQFSSKVALFGLNDYRYDPKVMYDPEADKFISIMLNGTDGNNYIVVGFSQTNDPAGAWNFYKFYGNYAGDTTWFDYPSISITKDEFFFTGNMIKFSTPWQTGFKQTVIYQVDKKSGYDSASALTYQVWDSIGYNGNNIRNLYPVKAGYNNLLGPEQYFLSNRNFDVQNDTVFLVKMPGTIASGNTNLTVTPLVSPLKYGVPPSGRQPDTSVTLATNDGRILGAYAMDDEIQFVSTTVNTLNGAAAIYHGRIGDYKNNPSIQYVNIFSVDTLDFGYPNISFAGNPWGLNQSLISFNYTGPNTNPGLAAIMFDGTGYSELVKIKEGVGSIKRLNGKEQRWGDYSGAQPDFNRYGSMWVLGIYGRADQSYGNWMAKISSPLLGVKETKNAAVQTSLYPNPARTVVAIRFELAEANEADFMIVDAQGRMIDKILSRKCKKGLNEISFDVASLATGNYFLKVASADGSVLSTHAFVKQ